MSPGSPSPAATVPCSTSNRTAVACERETAYISAVFLALVFLLAGHLSCRRFCQDRQKRKSASGANRGAARSASSSFSWLQDERQGFYGRYGGYGSDSEDRVRRGRIESGAWSVGTDVTPGRTNSFDTHLSADSTSGQSISSSVLFGGQVG